MGNRIDDGFRNCGKWKFIFDGYLRTFIPCTYRHIYFTHHKIDGLIYQLEYIALIDLVSRNRFHHIETMEMSTFYFRVNKKTLRLFSEQ